MSAKDLNKVNLISKMDVYVIVRIAGGTENDSQKKKTPVAHGDTSPTWKFPMKFTVDEAAARQNRLSLVFTLRCERALGDKDVGEVYVPMKELLDSPAGGDGKQLFVSYQVRKPSGKPKGQLTFSYKFAEKVAGPAAPVKSDEPVTAYPAPPMAGPSSVYPPHAYSAAGNAPYPPPKDGHGQGPYPPVPVAYPQAAPAPGGYPPAGPPPQGGYGYAYPPAQPYGGYPPPPPAGGYGAYPPPQQGYGYPPPQMAAAQPPKKNKFGMGLGAGLLGGALGGLLIGDMVSDAADYDAGGFDGGFDF